MQTLGCVEEAIKKLNLTCYSRVHNSKKKSFLVDKWQFLPVLTDRLGEKEARRLTNFSQYQTFRIFQTNFAMATLGFEGNGKISF